MEKEKASEVPGLPAASQRRGHLLLSAGGRRPAARPQPDPRPPSPPRSPPPRRSLLISYGILVPQARAAALRRGRRRADGPPLRSAPRRLSTTAPSGTKQEAPARPAALPCL